MIVRLLLDLDGTLIDSSPGIYHSFVLACDVLGLRSPEYTDFRALIGPPIQNIAAKLYPDLDPASLDAFRGIFRADYDNLSYSKAKWYPDVCSTLNSLSNRSELSMSIVTNKPTKPALELVRSAGLTSCFSSIVGIDYLAFHSKGSIFPSKSEALSYVLLSEPLQSSTSIYVGDTPSDRDACDRCGLPFIAALYGFHQWHHQQRPFCCIENFREIESMIYDIKI